MTKIAIQPNASGTGVFTLTAPNSNTDRTFSLPDATGEVYTSGNILGTVSQSGGVPTGAIIERGSNANGEFVKYADGTMICIRNLPVTITTTETNVYGSTAGVLNKAIGTGINFPSVFAATPTVSANPVSNTLRTATVFARSTSNYSFSAYTERPDTNHTVDIIAIGRWY